MERINVQSNNKIENMGNKEYIRFLESKGYVREQLYIDETSEIVTTRSLGEECVGEVVNIRCPSRYKIFILGRNQLLRDTSGDNILHTLSLRLSGKNGDEISPDSRIRIIKEKPSSSQMVYAYMLYKDVTKTEYSKIPPNRIKPDGKLYRFDNGIQMEGEDNLKIEVIQPDIVIDSPSIRLHLDIDLWEES